MPRHRSRWSSIIATLTCALVAVSTLTPATAEQVASSQEEKPKVRQLDARRFQIGKITFDSKTREIRFPAELNMTEGLLEFLIVHEKGSVHESLLATTISPTNLNVVFRLLNYTPSPELYAKRRENGTLSSDYPVVDKQTKAGSRIRIRIEWLDKDEKRTLPVSQWVEYIQHNGVEMPDSPWVYGGSEIYYGNFLPESTGDVCAIYASNSALINFPGEGAFDDTIWQVFSERVPAKGTKVTVVITPHQTPNDSSAP